MKTIKWKSVALSCTLVFTLSFGNLVYGQILEIDLARFTVKEAEAMALVRDSLMARYKAGARAFREQAVSAGQPPDPRLTLALSNVPIDTFSFTEEPMTQKMIGIQQQFPPLGSLKYRTREKLALAEAEEFAAKDRELQVLQGVRTSWLDLYFQYEAAELVQRNRRILDELVNVTRYQYRAGRGSQSDVLRAEMEQGLLEDRITMIKQEQDLALAELARWLGEVNLHHVTRIKFPDLPPLPEKIAIESTLTNHPAIKMADERLGSRREAVNIARTMYRPEIMIDVNYGQREADFGDMFSALVAIQLPLFTSRRQDKELAAAREEAVGEQSNVADMRRELKLQFDSEYSRWQRTDQRLKYFEQKLLPLASQNSEISLAAYKNNALDLTDQIMSRQQELDSSLEALGLQVERAKAHINLLYLTGEKS